MALSTFRTTVPSSLSKISESGNVRLNVFRLHLLFLSKGAPRGGRGWGLFLCYLGGSSLFPLPPIIIITSNNCKLGECVRWGRGGGGVWWWLGSGSGKGVQKPDELVISRIKIEHFYQYEYQQLSLSVLLFILPLYNLWLFHFSSKMKERTVLFTFTWLNL